jgi:hypothetical protein
MQLMHIANHEMLQCMNAISEALAGYLPTHTPAAYLGALHAFLWPGTQTPPFYEITQQGCQSTGLELRILIH